MRLDQSVLRSIVRQIDLIDRAGLREQWATWLAESKRDASAALLKQSGADLQRANDIGSEVARMLSQDVEETRAIAKSALLASEQASAIRALRLFIAEHRAELDRASGEAGT